MKKTILVLFLALLTGLGYSQSRIVYGKVTAFNKVFPVTNIVVQAKKANTSVLTDSLGGFAIACNKKDILSFNSKGFYVEKKRVIASTDTVNVILFPKEMAISEVKKQKKDLMVSSGYSYTKTEDSSYGSYNASEKLKDCHSYKDVADMIRGTVPGVHVTSDGRVRIRGFGSVNGNTYALIIIDGMEGQLSDIRPCDIKHISILKDAESAIYGARGAHGVVVIETML